MVTPAPLDARTHELAPRLGPDLLALVHARLTPVMAITEVTGLPSPIRQRASFCLKFADGTWLKGRRFDSPERAHKVSALLQRLGKGFPQVIATRGDALAVRMDRGSVLDSLQPIPPAVLVGCGELRGTLHRCASIAAGRAVTDTPARRLSKLARDSELLSATGAPGLVL